ncbi:MAG: hypothetical protein GQ475_06830 [Methylococcaceae bacterium]|nr:hypothetical protein [Methylococcaceae bacterium]
MIDPIVQHFLKAQKNEWLKKEIKPAMSDKKKDSLTLKASELFLVSGLTSTIKNLAEKKTISNLNFTSHIPKFSNPSIKLSGLIAKPNLKADGLLRTGNVKGSRLDIFSNSGAIDHTKDLIYVYEFLITDMPDGEMILEHLQRPDEEARKAVKNVFSSLNIKGEDFKHIRSQLLLMVNKEKTLKTSEAIKQVYFPVKKDYHLLSILYPSPLMHELRYRITEMQFSEIAKLARKDKKENKYNETPISDIYNLTKIGFGGANKQNISVLNNKHGGDFYLLSSVPPTLNNRFIQPPKTNFFSDNLYLKPFQEDFKKLHRLFSDKDTLHIKNRRRYWIKHIIYQVIEKIWQVRSIEGGWSESDTYKGLKAYQKIWLDQAQQTKRNTLDFDLIKTDLSRWLVNSYNKQIETGVTRLGDDHKPYIETIIDEVEEALQ